MSVSRDGSETESLSNNFICGDHDFVSHILLPLVCFECQVAAVRMEEVVLKISKVEGKPHLM